MKITATEGVIGSLRQRPNAPEPAVSTDASAQAGRFEQSPDEALASVVAQPGLLLLDLDETLYLRNSTEDFIATAVPATLARIILKLLDLLRPWHLTGGPRTRDVWRTALICILMPWTLLLWRRRVVSRAAEFTNKPLLAACEARSGETVIATIGFRPIVGPLIDAIGLKGARVVACPLFDFAARRNGKLALVTGALGAETVQQAGVLTDSPEDIPLLEACARPALVNWPDARYEAALATTYLPLEYLARVKRPGQRYFLHGVLLDDFAYWLIAALTFAQTPLVFTLGLFLLLISFWTIYEQGYVDNDDVATRYETDPKLTREYFLAPVERAVVAPWLWAAATGAAALILLRYPETPTLADAVIWTVVLVGTFHFFRLYNRYDKRSRVWPFLGLQTLRSCAFVVLVPIPLIAVEALMAHVIARWVPYYTYRYGNTDWAQPRTALLRLVFFLLLATGLMLSEGIAAVTTWTALAVLAWSTLRARRDIIETFKSARRIDRPEPNETRA